ncbi:MAG: sigma 54-interacting transcriptional regulator [Bacillota bacterium]
MDWDLPVFKVLGERIVQANRKLSLLTGYSLEELQSKKLDELIHPDCLATIRQLLNGARITLTSQREVRLVTKFKEIELWLSILPYTLRPEKQGLQTIIGFDISNYKKIAKESKLVEQRYFAIVKNMPDFLEIVSLDHKIQFVNDNYCKFLNLPREELIGLNSIELNYESDRETARRLITEAMEKGDPERAELRMKKADGEIIWVEWTGNVIYDKDGAIAEYQVMGRDITERKHLEEQLRKSRDELDERVRQRTAQLNQANRELTALNNDMSNIFQSMTDGIIMVDEHGTIQYFNKALGVLLGSHNAGVIKEILSEKQKNSIMEMIQNQISFKDIEVAIKTVAGYVYCLATGIPLENRENKTKKSLIIIKPNKEVHDIVNRISGAQARFTFEDIITTNQRMQEIINDARLAAAGDSNILISGESGTGKEMFAQAIHNQSSRAKGPFVVVNCGTIPRELVSSELFGYSEGAFTGAKRGGNPGKFELASGGTIFLDEIGDMPFEQQIGLLRVIQEKTVVRLGGNHPIPVDVRIICATNKNLTEEMEKGNFRADLYYRLNVIPISILPLRKRPEDIVVLFEYFLKKHYNANPQKVNQGVLACLSSYQWPGNVRELQNITERMLFRAKGENIAVKHLPEQIAEKYFENDKQGEEAPREKVPIKDFLQEQKIKLQRREKEEIIRLLGQHRGNVSQVAREMGISRSTLYYKMKNYKI